MVIVVAVAVAVVIVVVVVAVVVVAVAVIVIVVIITSFCMSLVGYFRLFWEAVRRLFGRCSDAVRKLSSSKDLQGRIRVSQTLKNRRRFGVTNSRVGASEGSVAAAPLRFSTFEVKFHYVFHYFGVSRTLDFTKNVTPNEQNPARGSILPIIPIEF